MLFVLVTIQLLGEGVDSLLGALVLLGDSNWLLAHVLELLFLLLDLLGELLGLSVELEVHFFHLLIIFFLLIDPLSVLVHLAFQFRNLIHAFLNLWLEFLPLLLLIERKLSSLLLLLTLELADLSLEQSCLLLLVSSVFLDLLKAFLQSPQVLLVVFLLLVSFLQFESFMAEVFLKLADFLSQLALVDHVLDASLVKHIELLLVQLGFLI